MNGVGSVDSMELAHGERVFEAHRAIRQGMINGVLDSGGVDPTECAELRTINASDMDSMTAEFEQKKLLSTAYTVLTDYLGNRIPVPGEQKLRHQTEAFEGILAGWANGELEGFVKSATSNGKTFNIVLIADALASAGLRVLVLAPKKRICRQIVGRDGQKGFGFFATHTPMEAIGEHFGGKEATAEHQIVTSTYQGFNNIAKDPDQLGKFDVIIGDEIHRGLGDVTSQNLKTFMPNAIKLGFSATPHFSQTKTTANLWKEQFFELGLRQSTERGITAPARLLIHETNVEIPDLDRQRPDFTERELERLAVMVKRNEAIMDYATDFVADGRQGLVACVPGYNLSHARHLASELSERTVKAKDGTIRNVIARAVGSFQSDAENEEVYALYEQGKIDVITFVNAIDEGYDSSRASFLINGCPTTSYVKLEQIMGRVFRNKPDGIESILVEFIDKSVGKSQATMWSILTDDVVLSQGRLFASAEKMAAEDPRDFSYLRGILRPELLLQLQQAQGKTVLELSLAVGQTKEQSEAEKWEQILASEGLAADQPDHLSMEDGLYKALQESYEYQSEVLGREPGSAELIQSIPDDRQALGIKSTEKSRIKTVDAIQAAAVVPGLGNVDYIEDNSELADNLQIDDSSQELVDQMEQEEFLTYLEQKVEPTDFNILKLMHGFYEDTEYTQSQIGAQYGVTSGRISAKLKDITVELQKAPRQQLQDWEARLRDKLTAKFTENIKETIPIKRKLLTADEFAELATEQQFTYEQVVRKAVQQEHEFRAAWTAMPQQVNGRYSHKAGLLADPVIRIMARDIFDKAGIISRQVRLDTWGSILLNIRNSTHYSRILTFGTPSELRVAVASMLRARFSEQLSGSWMAKDEARAKARTMASQYVWENAEDSSRYSEEN